MVSGSSTSSAFQQRIAHALARFLLRLLGSPGSASHSPMPVVDHRRAVDFGQAVDMGDVEAAAFIAASTDSGGGAAAVMNSTTCGSGFRSAPARIEQVDITIGAPHRCVTLCSAMAS
jgi:hypothetical protein